MVPDHVECSVCRERFSFPFHTAYYYTGSGPVEGRVREDELLNVPLLPAWCKDCDQLSLVEEILPLRDFEHALGAIRAGLEVDYPVSYFPPWPSHRQETKAHIEFQRQMDLEHAERSKAGAAAYLKWRMARHGAPRVLCCGGKQFQRLDDASCKIRHADCEFGFLIMPLTISSGVWRGNHLAPRHERVYDPEGNLIGLLLDGLEHPETGDVLWKLEAMHYPPPEQD